MKQFYKKTNFFKSSLAMLQVIAGILDEYKADGFVLTVRQLYYQLVARGKIENTIKSYKNIASLVNDGRMAGLLDWDMIEDRTRSFVRRNRWDHPRQPVDSAAHYYHEDLWKNQPYRVFVIVEKEALVGVLEKVCHEYDMPLLAARGYPSASVLRSFCIDDMIPAMQEEQTPLIIHLGDHDPSGIDMTRDLQERLSLFCEQDVELDRVALNMKQIKEQKPPENPAKPTDARFADYFKKYGKSSWELDALSPNYIDKLVRKTIKPYIEEDAWEKIEASIARGKKKLKAAADKMK